MVALKIPTALDPSTLYHLTNTLLPDYLKNTGALVIGVSMLSLVFGVGSAWLVTAFDFPLRRHMEWLLIMPLAIPAFIGGIAYSGFLDYAGPLRIFLRQSSVLQDVNLDIMNLYGVIFVMASVLYPYVYLTCRAAFLIQSGSLIEASRTLGLGMGRTFFRVILPVTWPAIVAGLSLIIMEVLNDYGTVSYFGVPTFTTGIFKSWLSLGDLPSAVFLSGILILFVLLLLLIEEWSRGRRRFATEHQERELSRVQLSGVSKWGVVALVFVPFLTGFLIPVFQMLFWLALTSDKLDIQKLLSILQNTVGLAVVAGLLLMVMSLVIAYAHRILVLGKFWTYLSKITLLGYALPGAVTAIGIIATLLLIDSSLVYYGVFGILFGYQIRFFAVGYQTLESGLKKIPVSTDEAALSMGSGPIKNLFRIHIPLLKTSMISGFILVLVDVAKELPITLILRPFNFETLATNAFQYAKDEMAPESAAASLLIIFVGLVPVYLLNKWLIKQ